MRKTLKNPELEYHPKLAIIRISILILAIFLLFQLVSFIKNDNNNNPWDNYNLTLLELNEKEEKTVVENSRGEILSLSPNVKVSGDIKIDVREGKYFLVIDNFHITNNKNIKLLLSTNVKAQGTIELGKLEGNIGTKEVELPNKVDFTVHKYLIFWDSVKKETQAYVEFENINYLD